MEDLKLVALSEIITKLNKHQVEMLKFWNKKPGATEEVKKELSKMTNLITDFFIIANG